MKKLEEKVAVITGGNCGIGLVSHRFKLSQATEALEMLKDGKILGRGVINP